MPADLRLVGVLETVLYYGSDQQDEMERFYENVLGLESLGLGRWSLAFRLGQGVVLLFDRERSMMQDEPPAYGASGSVHAAFLAAPGEYGPWKERLADRGVTLIDEIAWDSGVRSCYFNDPAGNLLEIAERDLQVGGVRSGRTCKPPRPLPPVFSPLRSANWGSRSLRRAPGRGLCRSSAKTRQPSARTSCERARRARRHCDGTAGGSLRRCASGQCEAAATLPW